MSDLPVAEVGGEDLLGGTVLADPHAGRKFGGKVKDSVLAYVFLAPALVTFAWPPVLVAVSVNVSPLSDAVSLITAVRTSSVVPLTGIAT